MASNLKVDRLEAPSLGVDSDSAPEAIARGKAPILQNLLPGYPGLVRMRGPLPTLIQTLGSNPADKIAGIWSHGDTVIIGVREGHATRVHEHHTTWYRRAADTTLARGTTTMYVANLLDGTAPASVVVTRATTIGPKFTRQQRYLYGPAYDTADDTNPGNVYYANGAASHSIRRVSLLRFDTQGAAAAPVAYANAPRGAQDAKIHYNRLFLAGGPSKFLVTPTNCATGSFEADIEPNTIWYSQDFGQIAPDTSVVSVADPRLKDEVCRWAHPVTFAPNTIRVDSADPSDFIVGFAKVGRNLAIFKRNSIHVLYGYGPSTFAVREFAKGVGCLDPRSIVEVDNGCFFLAKDGFMYFDGSQLINMSQGIDALLHEKAGAMVGDVGVDGGMVSAARLSNEYVGLAVSDAKFSVTGGVRDPSVPQVAALLHIPSRSWTFFTSDVLSTASQPTWFAKTDTRAFCTDDNSIWELSRAVAPLTVPESGRGFDGDVSKGFTITAGSTFTGTGNTLKTGAAEAWTTGTGLVPIVTSWKSRLVRLGTPLYRAQLHRIGIDYRFIPDGQSPPLLDEGFYVTVYDGDNNVIVPQYQLPVQQDPPTEYSRERHRKDVFQEVSDLYVKIEWLGPYKALAYADILDVWLEYQVTREFH